MGLYAAIAAVVGGLLLLTGGGEFLVRGAVALARQAGLTTAVIGLTVVAMGTSLPELVVSLIAAFRGTPDIAMGNVVGSNIANIGLILGLSALLVTLPVHGSAARIEWPFMFAASWVTMLLVRDGLLDRLEGGFLFVSLILFVTFMVREARTAVRQEETDELVARRSLQARVKPVLRSVVAVVAGIGLLVVGGRLLVDGSVALARLAGVTERVIGLTVVAMGTSMPELATSLVAAYRRHADVAVANIIGSNIFNLLAILGVTALAHPIGVSEAIIRVDLWWMLAISFVLFPFLWYRSDLSRLEGLTFLTAYVVYIGLLFR